jgi:two-component system invasion response regulator UvrY
MIRIVVAEDHNLVRQGICKLLEDSGDMQIIGEVDNGGDAVKLVKLLHPDVLVLDLSMPQLNGLETLAEVRKLEPSPHVVVLSMHSDPGIVQQALLGGALGYVLKQSIVGELLTAVRAANGGGAYLSSGVSQMLVGGAFMERPQSLLDHLSPREFQVVKLIVAGHSTRDIANSLHSSVKTVEKQRRDAMRKLQVENVASLVRVSIELGLSEQHEDRLKGV